MKKTKLWILFTLLAIPFFTLAEPIINPIYTSDRFQPSDAFHAGCENEIDLIFASPDSKIYWLNAILQYDSNSIEILNIIWENENENNLSYMVNNDKIVLSKLKTEDGWLDSIQFTLSIRSKDWVDTTRLSFGEWSYMIDDRWEMIWISEKQVLRFESVPECEPDIVSPSITLLFPSQDEPVALDTYYQFNITDDGKWINEDGIQLDIDWSRYKLSNLEHERDWSVLSIYPDFWMPLDTSFDVKILVSDKQVYWWSNSALETYTFHTSDNLYLLNEIDPVEFRKLVNSQKYYKWTDSECRFLAYQYALADNQWELNQKKVVLSINDRLSCPTLTDESIWNFTFDDSNQITVFSVLWWTLLGLLLLVIIFRYCSK